MNAQLKHSEPKCLTNQPIFSKLVKHLKKSLDSGKWSQSLRKDFFAKTVYISYLGMLNTYYFILTFFEGKTMKE